MAKELPPILRQYDRLIAVGVLAAVAISLIYLVFFGLQASKAEENFKTSVTVTDTETLAPVDFAPLAQGIDAAAQAMAKPDPAALLEVTEAAAPDLFTPERRAFCIKCANPILFKGEESDTPTICPFCKAPQPVKERIDPTTIDSDEDGLPDVWEKAHGLNPEDPADADADLDNDGFTNAEEYAAKTDPKDPKSHPGYEGFLRLGAITGTKVPLRITNAMQLPSVKDKDGKPVPVFDVTFVSVQEDGTPGTTPLRVKSGAPIGKTGFTLVSYNKKDKKTIKVGKHGTMQMIEVSTATVKRDSDGKTVTLTYWDPKNPDWPGEPLLELKAELSCTLEGVEPASVTVGAAYRVKAQSYRVKAIDDKAKTITLETGVGSEAKTFVVGENGPVAAKEAAK